MAEKLNQNLAFEFYKAEGNYVSPAEMNPTARERIRQRNSRIGRLALAAITRQS